jgi:transposase
VNEALSALAGEFSALYSPIGRPSIPPEKLLRAMLLQAFYSIRSERQLMERLEFDLLFRWFVGIEEAFGWIKMIAGQEKTKLRGRERVGWAFTFAAAAYNLTRLPKLMAAPT